MSETTNNICIINAKSGIGTSSPQISRFTHNFDCIKFVIDKDFKDFSVVIITVINEKVNIVPEGEGLIKSYDEESKSTHLLWYPQREVTADSGVVTYQIAAYDTGENKSVWYSKEGRLIVTDSVDTSDLSAEIMGSSPSLIMQLITTLKSTEADLENVRDNLNVNIDDTKELIDNFNSYKDAIGNGEKEYNPQSSLAQSGKAVAEAVAAIVNSAPETLNTLEELAKALGNDPNFATTIMNLLGNKVEKDTYANDMDYQNQRFSEFEDEIYLHKDNASNPHRVTKEQVGLSDVDNTSDKDKPVSDAVAKELKNKVDKLEKPKDSNVVYVETKSGNTIGIGYATNPKSFTIPQRLNLGELLVRDNPGLDNEAVSKGYVDKLVSENSNDINLDFNEIQNMPIKIKNLGTWKYVYDLSLDEEFEYIESDYSTFEEALDNATETGIYRLKRWYTDVFEGEETVAISDDCLLFVFEGVETYNRQKVVHQLLLSSVDFYGGFSKWSLPKVRTYCFNDEDGEMAWTVWSNEPDDYRFINYGFENALFKVDNIDEDYRWYDGSAYYPTVSAVINYVQKILTGFKPEVEIPMPAESIRANILHEPTLIYEDDPLIDFLTLSEDNSSGDGWYSWQVPYLLPTNEFEITNDLLDNSHAFSVYSASVIGKMYTSLTSRIANLESKITELESKIS